MKTSLIVAGLALSSQALASNYPSDYCHQIVRTVHDGAALFAHVGSGCGGYEVIGYKDHGILANNNPEFIDAIVVGSCGSDSHTSVVRVGREWHGNGYVSEGLSFYNLIPQNCDDVGQASIQVAFSANGQWDSRYGRNYDFSQQIFYTRQDVNVFKTNEVGGYGINLPAWNFIVSEMAR